MLLALFARFLPLLLLLLLPPFLRPSPAPSRSLAGRRRGSGSPRRCPSGRAPRPEGGPPKTRRPSANCRRSCCTCSRCACTWRFTSVATRATYETTKQRTNEGQFHSRSASWRVRTLVRMIAARPPLRSTKAPLVVATFLLRSCRPPFFIVPTCVKNALALEPPPLPPSLSSPRNLRQVPACFLSWSACFGGAGETARTCCWRRCCICGSCCSSWRCTSHCCSSH